MGRDHQEKGIIRGRIVSAQILHRLQIRCKVSSLLVTVKYFKCDFFEEKEHIGSLRTQQPLTTPAT